MSWAQGNAGILPEACPIGSNLNIQLFGYFFLLLEGLIGWAQTTPAVYPVWQKYRCKS
jgi:hypothetical protein